MNLQLVQAIKLIQEVKTCFTCEHCNREKSICEKFQSQPPFKIIENGCPQWEQAIPF